MNLFTRESLTGRFFIGEDGGQGRLSLLRRYSIDYPGRPAFGQPPGRSGRRPSRDRSPQVSPHREWLDRNNPEFPDYGQKEIRKTVGTSQTVRRAPAR